MCPPAALAGAGAFGGLSTVLTVASTALSFFSSMSQARAESRAAQHNAQVAAQNQKFAEERAQDAKARGAREEKQHRLQVAQILGEQRAGFGAGGVTVGSGSPLDVQGDTAALGELDALTIRSNAEREAFEHRIDAFNFGSQSRAATATARNARTAGWLRAGNTALGGVGTLLERRERARGLA